MQLAWGVSLRVINPVGSHTVSLIRGEILAVGSGVNPDILTEGADKARKLKLDDGASFLTCSFLVGSVVAVTKRAIRMAERRAVD